MVGDEIDDGDVRLVPDGADDGRLGVEHGLGHDAFVECPEILDASAAAGDDHGVDAELVGAPIDGGNGLRHCRGRGLALDRHAHHQDVDERRADPRGLEDVLQRIGLEAGDHRHAARERRQRATAFGAEPALLVKLTAQCLVARLQESLAASLHGLDVDLRAAALAVVRDGAGDDHFHAGGGHEAHRRRARCPHDAADLALVVLQREVPVARAAEVRNLAHHADAADPFHRAQDALGRLRHRERCRLAGGIEQAAARKRRIEGSPCHDGYDTPAQGASCSTRNFVHRRRSRRCPGSGRARVQCSATWASPPPATCFATSRCATSMTAASGPWPT